MKEEQSLNERLTSLLMDNGAAVTKQSIEALIDFIAERDQGLLNKVIRDAERTMREAQTNEFWGTRKLS